MEKLIRRIDLTEARGEAARELLKRQWLVTNGLGGYASATLSGSVTWRYHGVLIAALPAPFGRIVMLNHLAESLRFSDGRSLRIGGEEPSHAGEGETPGHYLTEFRLENHLPIWRFQIGDVIIEKQIHFLYGQNTVHVSYRLLDGPENLLIELQPSIDFRGHEQDVTQGGPEGYSFSAIGDRYEVSRDGFLPRLRMVLSGGSPSFICDGGTRREIFYQRDAERGYPSRGILWSPGYFSAQLRREQEVTLIASTEWWHAMLALSPAEALRFYHDRYRRLLRCSEVEPGDPVGGELALAGDQFIITPAGRIQDAARAHAAGDEIRTVIAGYHWFTDWGRDTMISLEGLTLTTRRFTEAGWILRTFAHYMRRGLIPNLFPEGRNEGLYHTADATLWFFHALARYIALSGDRETLVQVLPKLIEAADRHLEGTDFGIRVDPADGLLRQGAEGYQLTWMDAKVGDWVVTPRRGKAVEINGLWYNALRLLEGWLREQKDEAAARPYAEHARRCRESFNRRFWYAEGGYLYDVVDGEQGDNSACRPNQLLAFSLDHPVLDEARWEPVLSIVEKKLLTPVGLRSLSPGNPDYKAKYFGDLRARDAAYHQGTVWAWLIGPFIDAWLRVHPGRAADARKFLEGFVPHLNEACVGSISEIFDAEAPFTARGCIAQAWSVAEVLRCWVKTGNATTAPVKTPKSA